MDYNDASAVWTRAKEEYTRIKRGKCVNPKHIEEMLDRANAGSEQACLLLALIFLDPTLETYDPRKAIQCIQQLVRENCFDSVHHLSEHLVLQRECDVAVAIGMKALRAVAKAGHTSSQHLLSCFLYDGVGTEKNAKEALDWLVRAARLNDSEAQLALAYRYLNGDGVPKQKKLAFYWARRAESLGNSDAFWILWMEELDDNT